MTPVNSLAAKKRRITPSNSGTRCVAKNVKVEQKKAPERSTENPSDDKVVSSSCEVDCSNAVSWSASPKALPSRSSLDYFVHATQKLEVTTSSTDGDLVDLTAEDDAGSEAAALTGACTPVEADVIADATPVAASDDRATKLLMPVAAKPKVNPVRPLTCVAAEEAAELEKANDDSEIGGHVNDSEVRCSQRESETKPAYSSTASSDCATVQLPEGAQNSQEVDTQTVLNTSYDGHATQNTADCVGESPSDRSSSDGNDDMDVVVESPTCENADDVGRLGQAAVVLVKLSEENIKVANGGKKSPMSTTTSANMNVSDNKVTGHVNQKPKVR